MRRKGTLTLRRDDGRIVCETVVVADRWGRRLRGLLGKRRLHPGQGLLLRPCFSIQTMFMRFPIDAVFVGRPAADGLRPVLAVHRGLPAWRGLVPLVRGAHGVLELPVGTIETSGTVVGDQVEIASR